MLLFLLIETYCNWSENIFSKCYWFSMSIQYDIQRLICIGLLDRHWIIRNDYSIGYPTIILPSNFSIMLVYCSSPSLLLFYPPTLLPFYPPALLLSYPANLLPSYLRTPTLLPSYPPTLLPSCPPAPLLITRQYIIHAMYSTSILISVHTQISTTFGTLLFDLR